MVNSSFTKMFSVITTKLFLLGACVIVCSSASGQREPLNGWNKFGQLDSTFFHRAIIGRYVYYKSWPEELDLPEDFSEKYKLACEKKLREVYASNPVYAETLKVLKRIRSKEGIVDPPKEMFFPGTVWLNPDWEIAKQWGWFSESGKPRDYVANKSTEPIELWYPTFNAELRTCKAIKLESRFPNDLGRRYAELVDSDEWKRKTYAEPQAFALKSVLTDKQFDAFVAFAIKHCGVSFFRDECICCLLELGSDQLKRIEKIRSKTARELDRRMKRWNEAIKSYENSEKTTQDLILLKKLHKESLDFQFDIEEQLFDALNDDQQRQLKRWRNHPVDLKSYKYDFDVWIPHVSQHLFELPESPNGK